MQSLQTAPYLMPKQPTGDYELQGNERYEGYCKDLTKQIADIVGGCSVLTGIQISIAYHLQNRQWCVYAL